MSFKSIHVYISNRCAKISCHISMWSKLYVIFAIGQYSGFQVLVSKFRLNILCSIGLSAQINLKRLDIFHPILIKYNMYYLSLGQCHVSRLEIRPLGLPGRSLKEVNLEEKKYFNNLIHVSTSRPIKKLKVKVCPKPFSSSDRSLSRFLWR